MITTLSDYLKITGQRPRKHYNLDDENDIIIIENPHKTSHNKSYIMIHYRKIDDQFVIINEWYLNNYVYENANYNPHISKHNLFMVQNGMNNHDTFDAVYDYKKGMFVIPKNIWNDINSGANCSFLKKYNGFIAYFNVSSDYEYGDYFPYENPVTMQRNIESLEVTDGNYFAILNLDGTIRGNKLFKGQSFSKIEEIIDLNLYSSLKEFKAERKRICNKEKEKMKKIYESRVFSRVSGVDNSSIDDEIVHILNLK